MSESSSSKRREITVINWLGTLILSIIPGLNIIMFIIWAITSRRSSKRNFAAAAIILTVLLIVLTIVACALWGEQIATFLESIKPATEPAATGAAVAIPSVVTPAA